MDGPVFVVPCALRYPEMSSKSVHKTTAIPDILPTVKTEENPRVFRIHDHNDDYYEDHSAELTGSFVSHRPSTRKILSTSVHDI